MKARLKRQCSLLARTLALPPSWTVSDLAARLSTLRDRPVHIDLLPPSQHEETPCGLWMATDTADYIYARQGTSTLHHKHFILHEVGHMMCGHEGLDPSSLGLATMVPHLPPSMIRRALARTTYTDPQEREAESFAGLLYHSIRRNWNGQESDELAQRAGAALGIRD